VVTGQLYLIGFSAIDACEFSFGSAFGIWKINSPRIKDCYFITPTKVVGVFGV